MLKGDNNIMKITDIETIILRIKGEIQLKSDGTQDALIIKVHTDEGITGIGEVDSSPYVVKAAIEAPISHSVCYGLREILIGEDPLEIGKLWDKMYKLSNWYGLRGVAIHAMSGIDIALWDIFGKVTNQPIYKLLGGAFQKKIRAYASTLFPDTPEEMKIITKKNIDLGYTAIKYGWNQFGKDEKRDLLLVETARKTAGDDIDIMIDAGLGYTDTNKAIQVAKKLKDFNVYWLEEPFPSDNIEAYAKLSNAVDINIAAGERIETHYEFKKLIENAKVDIIQPDITRAGGFTECKKIAVVADLYNKLIIPHGWSTDVLLAATLHFDASLPVCKFIEFCIQDSPLRKYLIQEPFKIKDGYVEVRDAPGLGIELNEKVLNEYRIG